MQRLRVLAGTDLDRRRRAQLRGAQHAIERGENQRMHREVVEHPGLREKRVDPSRAMAFEIVAA